MSLENVEIREVGGLRVLIADMPRSNYGLTKYAGLLFAASHKKLGVVLRAGEDLDKVVNSIDGYYANEFSAHRAKTFEAALKSIDECAFVYPLGGDYDDDGALKSLYPPPEGIEVSYRWDAGEHVYRLEAYTEKAGTLVTRLAKLYPREGDFDAQVAKAYERFQRTCPAPKGPRGVRCGAHVADLLGRLDVPGAAALRTWLEDLEALPLHARGSVRELVLPGRPMSRDLLSARLTGIDGREDVNATLTYRKGNRVDGGKIGVRGALPQTVLAALTGRSADELWGCTALSKLRIGKHIASRDVSDQTKEHEFEATAENVPLPRPDGKAVDEEEAVRILEKNYTDISYQTPLRGMLSSLPPSWILHIVRTLRSMPGRPFDLRHVPGAEAKTLRLEGNEIRIDEVAATELPSLWRRAKRMAD